MALIDKASLLMVPSTYEAGTLYNVLPSGNRAPDSTDQNSGYDQTRADFTFSRGANLAATRINSSGLIEKGRENLLLQSNSFDTTWTLNNASVTSGQADKDGGTDAWLLTKSAASARVQQSISQSGVQTYSVYAKAGTLDFVMLNNGVVSQWYDLSNGTIGTNSSSANTIDANIEDIGNGWYRCSLTFNSSITVVRIYPSQADNDVSGTSGSVYIQDAQLEQSLVATPVIRTTTTTAKAGVLENMPRIDYSSGAGALLLEGLRTNLITQSEYFGAWTLNGGGTGSNPVLDFGHTSPEGLDNAYKVTFDTGAGTTSSDESIMYISKSGLTIGNEYTASVYLKGAVGGEEVIVRDTEGSYTKWTLTNEWKRYEMTQTAVGGSYATSFGVRQGLGGIGTINSNAVVYMYAFQSEAASYPSSYIPTMGTAASRAADVCIDAGNSDVFNDSEGVLFVEMSALADDNENRILSISDGTTSTRALIQYYTSSNTIRGFVQGGGVSATLSYTSSDITANTKIAFKYKSGDHALWVNGTERNTDTTAITLSGLDDFSFDNGAGAAGMYANVKQAIYFNEALSDSELATLTTL